MGAGLEFSYQFFWGVVASAGVSWGVMRQSVLGLSESVKDLRMRLDALSGAVGELSSRKSVIWEDLNPAGKPIYASVDRYERTSKHVCQKIQGIMRKLEQMDESRDAARREHDQKSTNQWKDFDQRLRALEAMANRLDARERRSG